MYRLIVALFIAASPALTHGGEPTPDSISSTFFEILIKGDGGKAIDGFFALNPQFANRGQQIQLMKSQLVGALQIYGPATAVELVSKEDLAPSLHRRVYITKHEFHPLQWEMYYYKGKSGWLPDQLLFVDQYQVIGPKK